MLQEEHGVLGREGAAQQPDGVTRREGNATSRPGMWAKIDSPLWECQMAPPVRYPPMATRTTRGQVKSPLDRHRMVAASLRSCCMAGQM